jgi:hypothetical protein
MLKQLLFIATASAALLLDTQHLHAINLPATPVTIAVTEGSGDSFFDATLSDVPSGNDVANNTYLMWCIDFTAPNPPLVDGGVHQALLLSSLAADLPGALAALPWDKINYLLNHKQGSFDDVQHALWFFTDGHAPDESIAPRAAHLIEEANAKGAGFVPGRGDVVAAITLWLNSERQMQLCIIEVPPVTTPECSDRFTSGGFIFRDGSRVTFGIQGGYQNGRLWGGINFVDHGLKLHVHSRNITSYTVLDANCRRATYDVTINGAPETATVRICDNGEPGRDDVMEITLSNGYSAGIGSSLGGDRRGGGNVQLHKPRCTPRATRPTVLATPQTPATPEIPSTPATPSTPSTPSAPTTPGNSVPPQVTTPPNRPETPVNSPESSNTSTAKSPKTHGNKGKK